MVRGVFVREDPTFPGNSNAGLWLAGNEGMKKMMESTRAGYMSSYLIHS